MTFAPSASCSSFSLVARRRRTLPHRHGARRLAEGDPQAADLRGNIALRRHQPRAQRLSLSISQQAAHHLAEGGVRAVVNSILRSLEPHWKRSP